MAACFAALYGTPAVAGAPSAARALATGPTGSVHAVQPATGIPATTIYLNRSQTSGTYVLEYVTLNNSSSLTRIPTTLTVVTSTCKWVTVLNLTAAASPATILHNVQYRNVTKGAAANATGTVVAKGSTSSFLACGGNAYWVNYVYWTYSVYRFASHGLGINTTVKLGNFSTWPGTIAAGPKNVSATMGPGVVAQFVVPSNLTLFYVTLVKQLTTNSTCIDYGQVCSYWQYTLSAAADAANTTTHLTIQVQTATCASHVPWYACVQAAAAGTWQNWTVNYTSVSLGASTSTGSFFQSTAGGFTLVFTDYWWAWVLVLLLVLVIVLAARKKKR